MSQLALQTEVEKVHNHLLHCLSWFKIYGDSMQYLHGKCQVSPRKRFDKF